MARRPQDIRSAEPAGRPARRVLLVDDSRVQRKILAAALGRWGYEIEEAGSGTEALDRLKSTRFDFVLSDWMMPGLDGPSLCRAFRALEREGYGYFILLTARNEKEEVAQGLEVGADDFLAKPVNLAELHARMIAGERILDMERELLDKNRLITATLDEMRDLYAALDRDLIEARKLQMTLVSERERDFGLARVAVLLRPSGHVGGDLVGYFRMSDRKAAFYAIDVSGHGVASAILAARLAGMLSTVTPESNAVMSVVGGNSDYWPPDMVAARLNRLVLEQMQVDQYLTLAYAEADMARGRISLVQAGHPHPLVLRADGRVEIAGNGGLPIGLIPGAHFERIDLQLNPGDRIIFMSDGMTEARDPEGLELGEEGLAGIAARNRGLTGPAFLEALMWDVERFVDEGDLSDDISAVVYEQTALEPD